MATISLNPRGKTTNAANLISNPRPVGVSGYGVYIGAPAIIDVYADFVFARMDSPSNIGGMYTSMKSPVTPGATYTASAEVFTQAPIRLTIHWLAADNSEISATDGPVLNGDLFGVRSFTTGIAPAGAANATLTFYLADPGQPWMPGNELRIRKTRFGFGTNPRYFDGGTAPVGDATYIWWSTPNASFSSELVPDPVTLVTPELVLGYETSRESRNVLHQVLDRPDPVPTLRPAALRTGTLELLFLDETSAVNAVEAHSRVGKLYYSESDLAHSSMWYVVPPGASVTRTLDPETRRRWIVSVPYQEVAP